RLPPTADSTTYPLPLHDALPICHPCPAASRRARSRWHRELTLPAGGQLREYRFRQVHAAVENHLAVQDHRHALPLGNGRHGVVEDRKSTRLNSSHVKISYAVFCL